MLGWPSHWCWVLCQCTVLRNHHCPMLMLPTVNTMVLMDDDALHLKLWLCSIASLSRKTIRCKSCSSPVHSWLMAVASTQLAYQHLCRTWHVSDLCSSWSWHESAGNILVQAFVQARAFRQEVINITKCCLVAMACSASDWQIILWYKTQWRHNLTLILWKCEVKTPLRSLIKPDETD